MARGFATGLFHGALVGAVGLGALSLALPAPQVRNAALVPDAAVIGTPAGSEFGRGEDSGPLLPAPLTRPAPAPLGGAASVDAPADAGVRDDATVTAARPETRAEDPVAPPEIAPAMVDTDLPVAPSADSRPDNRTALTAPEPFESPAADADPLPIAAANPAASDPVSANPATDDDAGQSAGQLPADSAPPAIAALPVVRPGLPQPPDAESPADMSALTRGRPEDGLGAIESARDGVAEAVTEALTEVAPEIAPQTTREPVAALAQAKPQVSADSSADAPPVPAAATAGRHFPAMNLSTPPDIGGLLAGQ